MAWNIEVVDGCAVVRMNTNKVNVQNDQFFADLHGAFDRLERDFGALPGRADRPGRCLLGGHRLPVQLRHLWQWRSKQDPRMVSELPRQPIFEFSSIHARPSRR